MNAPTQGIRRHVIAAIGLAAASVLGSTIVEPMSALAAPTKSGNAKVSRRKAKLPVIPKAKTAPTLPVGEARISVPYRSHAITDLYVWVTADISSVDQVRFEISNLTEGTSAVFDFGANNTREGSIGGDRVHIMLDPDPDVPLHHWLSFRLYSDYIVKDGCPTSWDETDKEEEIWSIRVSGGPYGGELQVIPLAGVVVGSFDRGDTCTSNLSSQELHCIDPVTSVVAQPNPGTVRSCTRAGPGSLKTP